jgi:hypothetical protein
VHWSFIFLEQEAKASMSSVLGLSDEPRTAARAGLSVYFAAGISVRRQGDMFRDAMNELERRCRTAGIRRFRTHAFYPYGYIDDVPAERRRRFIASQVASVFRDMWSKAASSLGGQALYREVRDDYDKKGSGDIVLVGHSGGGIASYKAAQLLVDEGYPVSRVVMVGSPELPVRRSMRKLVCTIEHGGRWGDWICRCGFHCFSPARYRAKLPLAGWHPHYFCGQSIGAGQVANLEMVMDTIWNWIQPEVETEVQPVYSEIACAEQLN